MLSNLPGGLTGGEVDRMINTVDRNKDGRIRSQIYIFKNSCLRFPSGGVLLRGGRGVCVVFLQKLWWVEARDRCRLGSRGEVGHALSVSLSIVVRPPRMGFVQCANSTGHPLYFLRGRGGLPDEIPVVVARPPLSDWAGFTGTSGGSCAARVASRWA